MSTVSIREVIQQNFNPRAPSPTRSPVEPSLAQPITPLGAGSGYDVAYLSPAARALSSPEAAQVDAPVPPIALEAAPPSSFDQSA